MNRVRILDCTLRDGGYINNFHFGYAVIKDIIAKLSRASIDIIECGFLRSGADQKDDSLFGSVESVKEVLGDKNPNSVYVAMIQYGAIAADEISECDHTSIDGIRVTFHEHEAEGALLLGKQLIRKGYQVYMQPVGTTTYQDQELLDLIRCMNELKPYAFYIVDTLGMMYKNDLLRMFYLIDHNLDRSIAIGFHSHNNLQLSFSNAQQLISLNSERCLIIDGSVYGLGRGAGNLNTELITQYMNFNFGRIYDHVEILEIIDEYIMPLSMRYSWGYNIVYYIASVTGCHPNYASFLLNKQTIPVQNIYAILNSLDSSKKALFDKDYIASRYKDYMNHHIIDTDSILYVKSKIGKKKVLVLAPGKSLKDNMQKIQSFIQKEDCYVISVNFLPADIRCNMIFVSNKKRFKGIGELSEQISAETDLVVTSNIRVVPAGNIHKIDYLSYSNEEPLIIDNAGLMCLNFLKKTGIDAVSLAGFDGFSTDRVHNFFDQTLLVDVKTEKLLQMNAAITERLAQLGNQMKIEFITDSCYQKR